MSTLVQRWVQAVSTPADEGCICSLRFLRFFNSLSNVELRQLLQELSAYPPGEYPGTPRRKRGRPASTSEEERRAQKRAYGQAYRERRAAAMTDEEKAEALRRKREQERSRLRRRREQGRGL